MASARGSTDTDMPERASGQKRTGEPSTSEFAEQQGHPSKSTRTEGSIVSPRRTESHLTPPGAISEEEGNPKHRMSLKLSGYLGHRIDINLRYKKVTYLDLCVDDIRGAIEDVFNHDVSMKLMQRHTMSLTDVQAFTELATRLVADATMRALYARLRALHFVLNERRARYTDRPTFPSEAEIPAPFASLIQGIGRIRIRDYPDDLLIAPTYPEGIQREGASATPWSYASYISVVEELKSIGIPFRSIAMKDTQGGSWWLLRDRVNENRHELVMPFPVTNYTEHGAILRGLLLCNSSDITERQIVNFGEFKYNYGTILREVGIGDNLLYFRALIHEDESKWRPATE